ncbi:lustrin, cysteine-rich repeated domain-containing protein [Ditylenchus destructor]|nr:lustrin, cysteine-rich repeated domain-containing protein [Ditylenchus destructor]
MLSFLSVWLLILYSDRGYGKLSLFEIIIVSFIITLASSEEQNKCITGSQPFRKPDGSFLKCVNVQSKYSSDECLIPYKCDQETSYCCPFPFVESQIDSPFHHWTRPMGVSLESEQDHHALCGPGGRLLKGKGDRLTRCQTDSDCLPPSICYNHGYCCLIALAQEPPPIGCPKGTRPLKNIRGEELSCSPNRPDSCPGGHMCYEDSLDGSFKCCGKDPSEGCASGTRAVKLADGSTRMCLPGTASEYCPGMAICQWSFAIDRYICCEPDNGCPIGQTPVRGNRGDIIPCSEHAGCADGAVCRFNFWTASYQCCEMDKEMCPSDEVPYFTDSLSDPLVCQNERDCPSNYYCSEKSHICCGEVGKCPRGGENPVRDEFGRIRVCSLTAPDECPDHSKCREAVSAKGSTRSGQYICCTSSSYSCSLSGIPFPSAHKPQICNIDNPMACPIDMLCQQSNFPQISICCTNARDSHEHNLCPKGWRPHDELTIFCHPTLRDSCPGYASCILSPQTQQFLCCEPEERVHHFPRSLARRSNMSCPDSREEVETSDGRVKYCGRSSFCGSGYKCREMGDNQSLSICCGRRSPRYSYDDAIFRCSNPGHIPYLLNGNKNKFCNTLGSTADCPPGTICQSAINGANMFICCYVASSTAPICPANTIPQPSPGPYVPCDLLMPNQCRDGFICVPALNDPETKMCCSRTTVNRLICPNQQFLYTDGGRPRYCSPSQQAPCPAGFSCQESLGQPGVYVCCTVPSYTACPHGFTPSVDFYSGNSIHCSPSDQNVCPADAQCLQAQNRANVFLCCRSTEPPRVCPISGQHALLRSNGQPETCASPGSICSNPTYTCQFSQIMRSYVCCGSPPASALCADGRETYVQELGKTFTCNPLEYPTTCPAGYECAFSNIRSINVCCRRDLTPTGPHAPTDGSIFPTPPPVTFRPPVEELQCPIGWSAYADSRGAHHFCQDSLDMTCPQGFSCAQSSVTGIFLCCRLASTIQCPRSYNTLLVNNSPRLCSLRNANTCPTGYLCLQSSVPAVYVCCSAASKTDLLCRDGQIVTFLFLISDVPIICRLSARIYWPICEILLLNWATGELSPNIYLRTFQYGWTECVLSQRSPPMRLYRQESHLVCGETAIVFNNLNDEPQDCTFDSSICPTNYHCQPSMTNTKMYCCQDAHCPGQTPVISMKKPKRCYAREDCSDANRQCVESENMKGIAVNFWLQ